jgi:hypothetical protein
MNDTEKILIGFLLGLIASSFGSLLAHWLSEKRRKKENFEKAVAHFKNAFLPEIIYLKHNTKIEGAASHSDLNLFLNAGFFRQLKALEEFLPYLSDAKKIKIKKAWKSYCYEPENPERVWFEQYSWRAINKGKSYESELKKIALERIMEIIKHSK